MQIWDDSARVEEESEYAVAKIVRHTDLEVYRKAYAVAMEAYGLSKAFPKEERYSLTDQLRRSTRSVAANIAEGWRRRRYTASFVSKLNEAEAEAGESQSWLQFAVDCSCLETQAARRLYAEYDRIIAMLIKMQNQPENWCLTKR